MKSIAIFASGSGTNAENLIRYFRTNPSGRVELLLSNRPDAYAITRAQSLDIETVVFNREQFYHSDQILTLLKKSSIDFIVLAGFLWLVPGNLLEAFQGKVVNIHPALLPRYGGKGMYGQRVHEAVISSGDSESGITIHHVNTTYDDGSVIFQARCALEPGETPESLAIKVHALEHKHLPSVVEDLLNRL